MTAEQARVVLAMIARAAPFVGLTLAEMPLVAAAIRELEAEARGPEALPPEDTP